MPYNFYRFHQVDSENLTIAVNFWWQSDMMSGMLEHMDAYYLRRILKKYFLVLDSFGCVLITLEQLKLSPSFMFMSFNLTTKADRQGNGE